MNRITTLRLTLTLTLSALLLAAAPAWAINKCKGPDGKVTYQETGCASHESGEAVKIVVPTGSGTGRDPPRQLKFKLFSLTPDAVRESAATALAIARMGLKDPDSAKFTAVRVLGFNALGKDFIMTCGDVNAKNSYGGYVGSKPFWVYDGLFTQTFDHYLPPSKSVGGDWLMGDVQTACLKDGALVPASGGNGE